MKDTVNRKVQDDCTGAAYTYTKHPIGSEGVTAGDFVVVNDDGKRRRESVGKVLAVIDENRIVVEFEPFGYDEVATLVFQACDITEGKGYHALNPRPVELMREGYQSEYCLISGCAELTAGERQGRVKCHT